MTDESAEVERLEELARIENAGVSPPHVKVLRSDYNWLIRLTRRALEDTGERVLAKGWLTPIGTGGDPDEHNAEFYVDCPDNRLSQPVKIIHDDGGRDDD